VAGIRRLRRPRPVGGFEDTLERHEIPPGSPPARALAKAIGRLRAAKVLPVPGDDQVMLWGNQKMWAYRFVQHPRPLWLY